MAHTYTAKYLKPRKKGNANLSSVAHRAPKALYNVKWESLQISKIANKSVECIWTWSKNVDIRER